jgi:hypothetical protein
MDIVDKRNEQAVWQAKLPHGSCWFQCADANDAKALELFGYEVRALSPRPADARVPEARTSVADSIGGTSYALGWNDCRAEMLRLLATPPAAKPEQGEPDEDDYESDDRFVGHLYVDAPEVAQPKPAGEAVDAELLRDCDRVLAEAYAALTWDSSPLTWDRSLICERIRYARMQIARRLSGQEG